MVKWSCVGIVELSRDGRIGLSRVVMVEWSGVVLVGLS